MKKNRITIEELLSMLRLAGEDDIHFVRDAVLEPNGQLSVIRTDAGETSFAVVEDGKLNEKALSYLRRDKAWLNGLLAQTGLRSEQLFLVLADKDGIRFVAEKEE